MVDILRLVSRRKKLILATLAVVLAATAAYSWLATPVWQASAMLRIEDQNLGPTATLFPELTGKSEMETEMLVVETRPILGQAVETLGLNLVVLKPTDVPRQVLFSELRFERDTPGAEYTMRRIGADRYSLESGPGSDSIVRIEVVAGERVEIPGGSFSIAPDTVMRRWGIASPPEQLELRTVLFDVAVENLRAALSVGRPDRAASVVRISFDTHDQWLAPAVVNEVVRAFIDQGRAFRKAEARSTVGFLQEQSEEIEGQMEAAERALQDFREDRQVVSIQSEAQEQVRRLAELQTDRAALSAERDALATLFEEMGGSSNGDADFTRLVAFPSFQQVQAVQSLGESLVQAEADRTELRSHWTEGHPGVVAVDQQISQLKARLEGIGQNYLKSLNSRIASLDSVLVRFERDLEQVPARELEYARLERQAVLLADLYSVLRQRLKEAEVRAAVEDPNAVVVEPPVLPREPIRPRPVRYMVLALMAGTVLGLILALLREHLDTVLRRYDDVEGMLGLSVLSEVPRLATPSRNGGEQRALVTVGRGPSLPAEAFRTLRTSVFYAAQGSGPSKEILVTSSGAREGKSTTACNVAVVSAQQGLNTLLVDCDLRRGTVHRAFGLECAPGLSDFLRGEPPAPDILRHTGVPKLSVVPAGSPVPDASELLGSAAFDKFLEDARTTFEVIIVDSPPILAVPDAVVLSTKIGGVILVVRTNRTHRQAATAALSRLDTVGARVLGVVVNDSPGGGLERYRSSYYHDYYSEGVQAGGSMRRKR